MPTLSVPTIKVNNDIIAIVPNSFMYTSGDGEVKVRAASAGGGSAVSVHSQDAETMVSTVKFKLHNTVKNSERIRVWKENIGDNTVEAIQKGRNGEKDFALPFKHQSVTNDPEVEASADGSISVEMSGDKLE